MIIKKIVAITIITSLGLTFLLLVAGLLIPMSVLKKLEGKNNSANQNVQKLDQDGKPINGANNSNDPKVAGATQSASNTAPANGTSSVSTSSSGGVTTTTKPGTTPLPISTSKPGTTTNPTSTPAPISTPAPTYCGGSSPCYGRADLAAHSSTSNCWGYNGNVMYNLSGYAPRHPNGTSNVLSAVACGKDISGILNGSVSSGGGSHNHKSSTRNNTESTMQSYKVGYYDGNKP